MFQVWASIMKIWVSYVHQSENYFSYMFDGDKEKVLFSAFLCIEVFRSVFLEFSLEWW